MIRRRATAPGKVILFGEHSVVHGRHAVAVALSSLRVQVIVEMRNSEDNVRYVPSFQISIEGRIELGDIDEIWEGRLDCRCSAAAPPASPRAEVLESVRASLPRSSSAALVAVAYLISEIGGGGSVRLIASSEGLPIGAGLGSSAALAVACSAALLGPEENLQLVNDWAFVAEVVQHGTPSGLDNAVSCFGGGTVAKRVDGKLDFRPIRVPSSSSEGIQLLITNTRVPRKTKDLVDRVGELYREMPGPVGKLFDAVDDVVLDFVRRCKDGNLDPTHLSRLVEMNHGILRTLGTSHEALEKVVRLAAPAPTKLTGAGGGGCAITLLHGMSEDQVKGLIGSLEGEGYQCHRTALAGPGVQIFT